MVENDPELRSALGDFLEDEGMRVLMFRGVDEAIGSSKDERPLLCVVDGIGGAKALEGERSSAVPVVVFTGWKIADQTQGPLMVVDNPDDAGLLAIIDAVRAVHGSLVRLTLPGTTAERTLATRCFTSFSPIGR